MPTDVGNPDLISLSPTEQRGSQATKRCPFCAELILAAAIKCKHCGSSLLTLPGGFAASRAPALAAAPAKAASLSLIVGSVFFALSFAHLISRAAVGWFFVAQYGDRPFVPAWNTALCIGLCALLIGIKQRARWAFDWVVGTAAINTISNALNLSKINGPGDHPMLVGWLLCGAIFNAIAWYALRGTQEEFSSPTMSEDRLLQPRGRSGLYITIALIVGALVVSVLQQP